MADFPTLQNTSRPGSKGYGVALNGDLFRLIPDNQVPVNLELAARTPQRIQETPEDFPEGYAQSFSRVDYRGGAGLARAHRRRSDDVSDRYWDSHGVRVLPSGHITLAHATDSFTSTVGEPRLLSLDGSLFVADLADPDLVRYDNPLASTPTPNAEVTGSVGTIVDVTSLGSQVLAAATDGIFLRSSAGAWSKPSVEIVNRVWGMKGRLLVAVGNDLYELADPFTDALTTPIVSLPPGDTWVNMVDVGPFVVAAGSDGLLYLLSEDVSANLAMVVDSRYDLPGVEQVTSLGLVSGVLLIGTAEIAEAGTVGRLWATDATTALNTLRVIRSWGDTDSVPPIDTPPTVDHSPVAITAFREGAFVAVWDSAFDEFAVFRFDATTFGLHRELTFDTVSHPADLVLVAGSVIAGATDGAIWRERSTFVSSGWVTTPLADFFSTQEKLWAGVSLTSEGEAIDLYTSTAEDVLESSPSDPALFHPSWTLALRSVLDSTVSGSLINVRGKSLTLQARLVTTNINESPTLLSNGVRAYPPSDDVIITLPISVSDQIEQPGRRPFTVKGWGQQVYGMLRAKQDEVVLLQQLRPPYERIRGTVEAVSSPLHAYGDQGSSLEMMIVRVRGSRVSLAGVVSGVTWGSNVWGDGMFGGVDA